MSFRHESSQLGDQVQAGERSASTLPSAARLMPATQQDQAFFHFDLARSLYLHRWLAIGILGVAVALAAAYVIISGPVYTAQSLVYIQPAPPRMMESVPTQHWPYDANTYESYIQQQVHNVTRSDVLLSAVRKLPAGTWRQARESEQGAADRLARAVQVTRVGTGYQVSIAARARTPELAAQIANALATSFVENASRELRAGDTQRMAILREERDRVMKEMVADRSEQETLNKKLGVAAIGTGNFDPYDDQVSEIRAELIKARAANDEAAARLTSMAPQNSVSSTALDAQADELASADPGLVSMKTSLNARRAVLISQMANLTPSHPQYRQDAEELAQINSSLEGMMKDLRAKASDRIQQKLRSDLERTSSLEARLNGQLAQLTGAAGGATPRLQRANDLATDIQRLQNRFTVVDEQLRNLTMENNAPGADYISAPAVPPSRASESVVLRNAFVLVFAGLIFAVVAAVVANNIDQQVYIANDVERVLGFGPLAQLPDFYQVSEGVAEEYMLRVAAAIEHAHQQGGVNSCIFTGVAPGAGATTVVTRVRTMLEAMGRATILVDASGTAQSDFSVPSEGQSTTDLATIQRGRRPTALLRKMAKETGNETIVLTDTAPLLVSGETEYLARFVDSAIVVIESGGTTRGQLREVASTLQRLEVAAVGFVLNRVSLDKANPAFRESVKAVERHVEAQSLSHARRTAKNRPPVQPENPAAPSSAPQPEIMGPTGAARSITPAPEPMMREAAAVSQPDPPKFIERQVVTEAVAAAPIPLTPRPLRTEQPIKPVETTMAPLEIFMTASESKAEHSIRSLATPRSPLEALRFALEARAEQAPRMFAQGVETEKPQPVIMPPLRHEPRKAEPLRVYSVPQPSRAAQSVRPPARVVDQQIEPASRIEPARLEEETQPERHIPASKLPEPQVTGPVVTEKENVEEEASFNSASRLGGLRNLFASLGVNNLERGGDRSYDDNQGVVREAQHTIYPHHPFPNGREEVAAEVAKTPKVSATPDILPPNAAAEPLEREKEPVGSTPAPPSVARWSESSDEIYTLPSQRGQYRRP